MTASITKASSSNTDAINNTTKRAVFAQSIAETFNDIEHTKRYLDCCKKYSLAVVYRAFAEAKAVPDNRVRKSRQAIFFYLIKRYSHERKDTRN